MTEMILLSPMTQDQARNCITHLRYHLTHAEAHENAARQYARDLHDGQGWRVLGYPDLKACFVAELGISWQHGYRLIAAGEVDNNLSVALGESISIPDRHARELAKAPALLQAPAYARAQQAAAAEGVPLAGRHVEMAVKQALAEDSVRDNPVLARSVAMGEMTPSTAVLIKRELESLTPRLQGNVLQIITEYGLRDPKLVVPLAELSIREDSKTWEEIRLTGHIAGVSVGQATLTDLKRLKEEVQKHHISDSIEQARQKAMDTGMPMIEPRVVTIYRGDAHKTLKALIQALPTSDLVALTHLLADHPSISKEFWLHQQWLRQEIEEEE